MKRLFYTIPVLLLFVKLSFGQSQPKTELRGVWMATVANLDWPDSKDKGKPEKQKQSFIALLESMQEININVILLQVRTECDAFYKSSYEPWSRFLTGTQGKNPGYDPLQFAIEECHKRGMELHVWLNPYRVNASLNDNGNYYAYNHVYRQHPAWVLKYSSGKKILNPGLPQVQRYIKKIVGDILSKYDVDGVHFDDYFYSYSGTPASLDASTYSKYGSEYATVGDFRRASINKMIKGVMDTILAVKPFVRFGVSPFGIYGNNMNPPGISGLDAYNVIYCDPLAWLREKSVDYISPQLYWPTGGKQDFNKLLPWWAQHAKNKNRHVFAGHGIYRLDSNPFASPHINNIHENKRYFNLSVTETISLRNSWTLQEIIKQIRIVRKNRNKNALGSIFFRTQDFNRVRNLKKYIHDNAYNYKSLLPAQTWKNIPAPSKVTNLRLEKINGDMTYSLVWDNGGTENRYAVYIARDSSVLADSGDLPPSRYLHKVIFDNNHFKLSDDMLFSGSYIAVVKIDRYWNTSKLSTIFKFPSDEIPAITHPTPNAIFNENIDSVLIQWNTLSGIASYRLQLSDTVNFNKIILDTIISSGNKFIYENPLKKAWIYIRIAAITGDSTLGYWSNTLRFILDTELDTDDISYTENVIIFPNPAVSEINIKFESGKIRFPVKMELIDFSGRTLDKKVIEYLSKSGIFTWDIQRYTCRPCFIYIDDSRQHKIFKILKYK